MVLYTGVESQNNFADSVIESTANLYIEQKFQEIIGKEVLRSEVVRKSMSRMKKFIPSQLPTHPAQPTLPAHNSSIFDPPSLKRRLASSKADLSGMPVAPSSQTYSGEGST
jgi:hypothetical protein